MNDLMNILQKIDQKGYKAYKEIKGTYLFPTYLLHIDYVQGDPFASPSKVRISIPLTEVAIKKEWCKKRYRRVRCEDTVARRIGSHLNKKRSNVRGAGKSGHILFDAPKQKIIERSAVMIDEEELIVCLSVVLPANGRRIAARDAEALFCSYIPEIIERAILKLPNNEISSAIKLADQQFTIRQFIKEHDYIAFIANGSILPRESGVSDLPLKDGVIPFKSPESLEISIKVPHQTEPVKGMAIKKGITLIVGGGYHGKSTLLKAIENGIYDHCEKDGREFVITDDHVVKIRAEDGRSVNEVNISPFITTLPLMKNTMKFSTDNASGSTSQAANLVEMLEVGAKALLLDEDTTATNFMIRDARMQLLIAKELEPITPFVDKVEQLKDEKDVSTIIVMGGSGDYFDVADLVIKMEHFRPINVTTEAKRISKQIKGNRHHEGGASFGEISHRVPKPISLNSRNGKKVQASARGLTKIQYGVEIIDLQYVEQLVEESQTRMIADVLYYLERNGIMKHKKTINELLELVEKQLEEKGISFASTFYGHPGEVARPRRFEIAAALNRLRSLKIQ